MLFNIATIIPSLNPKTTKVTSITIFDNPNFAPGTGIGIGIEDSRTLKARPTETSREIKLIYWFFSSKTLFVIK
jgi:hypothetical protein